MLGDYAWLIFKCTWKLKQMNETNENFYMISIEKKMCTMATQVAWNSNYSKFEADC